MDREVGPVPCAFKSHQRSIFRLATLLLGHVFPQYLSTIQPLLASLSPLCCLGTSLTTLTASSTRNRPTNTFRLSWNLSHQIQDPDGCRPRSSTMVTAWRVMNHLLAERSNVACGRGCV